MMKKFEILQAARNPFQPKEINLDENIQVLLTLEYHGTNYGGWQRQDNDLITFPSVQGTLEDAATLTCHEFSSTPGDTIIMIPTSNSGGSAVIMSGTSGRTDRAVHALDQHCLLRLPFSTKVLASPSGSRLAEFLTGSAAIRFSSCASTNDPFQDSATTESSFLTTINRYLPCDIHVLTSRIVAKYQRKKLVFKRKRYRYLLQQCPDGCNRPWPPWNDYTYFVKTTLDISKMHQALGFLRGTHDFNHLSCQNDDVNTVRTLYEANLFVSEAPFDNIPWYVHALLATKISKKDLKKRKRTGQDVTELAGVSQTQADQSMNDRDSRSSVFSPPHFGNLGSIRNGQKQNFPRPEDCKLVCVEFEGNGFLRHQVRRMVSVLVKIGEGVWDPEYVLDLLNGGDTKPLKGLALAPGRGLWKAQVWIEGVKTESRQDGTGNDKGIDDIIIYHEADVGESLAPPFLKLP